MKRILSITFAAALLTTVACDKQVEDGGIVTVPTTVKDAFAKKFPDQKDVSWEVEGDYIEAEFEVDGMEKTIIYDASGNEVGSEEEISAESLPDTAAKYISANHPGSEALEYEKVVTEDATGYTVELKDSTGVYELTFNGEGIFQGTEVEDEDESPMEENDLN